MSTVILACKTPAGFIMEVNGVKLTIHGYNSKENVIRYDGAELIGITYDVPKDFWDAWRKTYASHDLNVNQLVFEERSEKSVKDKAKELKSQKSGMEQKTKEQLSAVAGAKEDPKNPED